MKDKKKIIDFAEFILIDWSVEADIAIMENGDDCIPDKPSPKLDKANEIPLNSGETLYDWIIRTECVDEDKVKQCLTENGINFRRVVCNICKEYEQDTRLL